VTGRTIGAALAAARATLREAGIESAALDARLLVAHALNMRVETIVAWPERPLPQSASDALELAVSRRAAYEPIAYIVGHKEFWSLDFHVGPGVLVPRPDTETLVAAVLDHVGDRSRPFTILDLGTGTGCILLSLLSELPGASGIGVDIDATAIRSAQTNADLLGVAPRARFIRSAWMAGIDHQFDIVVSNPPYIATDDISALPADVRHEPALALDGGRDGLHAYRAIIADVGRVLAPGGLLAVEIGWGQREAVEALLRKRGLVLNESRADFNGVVRCILARRLSQNEQKNGFSSPKI
jgi:release factor glutamine methyltransferase